MWPHGKLSGLTPHEHFKRNECETAVAILSGWQFSFWPKIDPDTLRYMI